MKAIDDALFALSHPSELVSAAEYRTMLRELLDEIERLKAQNDQHAAI